MSLQVWLPLTKDLRQQGLSNVTVTNNGATFNSAGKLGGCYSFNGSTSRIYNNNLSLPNEAMSGACWVKVNSLSGRGYFFSLGGNSSVSGALQQIGIWLGTDGHPWICGMGSELDTGYVLSTGIWYHVCMTYSGNTSKLYINGNLVYTGTNKNSKQTRTKFCVGARSNTDTGASDGITLPFNGLINDVRIYDHCLSPMEVKELAKGLVLHYPLNRQGWGQENIIPNSKIDGSWTYPSSSVSDKYSKVTTVIPSATQYTLSFDAKSTVNGDKMRTHYYSPNTTTTCVSSQGITKTASDGNMDFTLSTQWQRYWVIYTQTETTAVKHLICPRLVSGQGSGTVSVKNVKLEEGPIATPWCPNSSDTLVATMGLNSTTEYDCSGFGNNGMRTGTFSWTSDTPKYQVSSIHTGSNNIYLTPPSAEIQTIAVWVKWNTIPSGQSVILVDNGSGIGLGLMSTGILCSTSKAGNSYTFSKANLVANTWYHFVVVKTGTTTRKLYINGVEQTATSNTSNWSYSVNQLQLGKRSTTSDGFAGKLCDFRAYATALSANDVKSLYQNSAYVDSSGNVYGAVHMEV